MEKNFYIDIIRLKIMFNLTKINLKNYISKIYVEKFPILITGGTDLLVIALFHLRSKIQS